MDAPARFWRTVSSSRPSRNNKKTMNMHMHLERSRIVFMRVTGTGFTRALARFRQMVPSSRPSRNDKKTMNVHMRLERLRIVSMRAAGTGFTRALTRFWQMVSSSRPSRIPLIANSQASLASYTRLRPAGRCARG